MNGRGDLFGDGKLFTASGGQKRLRVIEARR